MIFDNFYNFTISIHAPTRGATFYTRMIIGGWTFQSTLLQEERLATCVLKLMAFHISIHAPTRGATAKMHNYPYTYL